MHELFRFVMLRPPEKVDEEVLRRLRAGPSL